MTDDDTHELRRQITRAATGAIRQAIAAHGPITTQMAPSAAKRVAGQLLADDGAVTRALNERTPHDDALSS